MFNFDIPASNAGKQCILSFLFPEKSMLETSDYSFSGDGEFEFYQLSKPASKDMSWNSAPALSKSLGNYKLTPGSAADIATFDCPAGQTVGFWMMSHNDAALHYFQDFNPCREFTHSSFHVCTVLTVFYSDWFVHQRRVSLLLTSSHLPPATTMCLSRTGFNEDGISCDGLVD